MGRSIFFEKNLRVQFDVVFDSESYGVIFDSLAPFGGELWRFINLKFMRQLKPVHVEFFSLPVRERNSKKNLHRTVPFNFFQKKIDLPTLSSFYLYKYSFMLFINN